MNFIDTLDAAICRLARHLNAESYRLLVLVRELDDRMGWAKWSFPSCAEWLAWRCGLSVSAAREKLRTAHALRGLPAISAAFRDGRLSYSKVRALTRAAHLHDEDLLLAYALEATASQVEERCRQIRNVAPESVDGARRAWERRALTLWRDAARGTLRITVEVPVSRPTRSSPSRSVISTPLKRALWARDRVCTFPGCDRKRYVDAHHIEHWTDGGATSLDNLTLLCSHHHRLLHEGRFAIGRDAHDELYYRRPDGRVIPRFGYRLADTRDDDELSAEVREPRVVYRAPSPRRQRGGGGKSAGGVRSNRCRPLSGSIERSSCAQCEASWKT